MSDAAFAAVIVYALGVAWTCGYLVPEARREVRLHITTWPVQIAATVIASFCWPVMVPLALRQRRSS